MFNNRIIFFFKRTEVLRRTVITEDSLRRAMRDDRYWQVQHPERGAYAGWVTKGWQALATSPLRTAAGQSMVSV